jgi:hypothetical protein
VVGTWGGSEIAATLSLPFGGANDGRDVAGFQKFGKAWMKDAAAARALLGRQASFFNTLMHPWTSPFCGRLEADAQTHPLYRWAAGLLREFCRQEESWLTRVG